VYLHTEELGREDENGVGRRFRLHTQGGLPYTLRWESCAIEVDRPHRIRIRATGDFVCRGVWTLNQNGDLLDLEFDWKRKAEKPIIRYLSFLLKPLYSANHRWAMARGQGGLARELQKRREEGTLGAAYVLLFGTGAPCVPLQSLKARSTR
jgi:hypothetical protein